MALIRCKDCGKEFSSDAKSCIHCGAKAPKQASGCMPIALVMLVSALVLIAVLIYAGTAPGSSDYSRQSGDRAAIEQCKKDRDDELNLISTRRLLRDTCAQLEQRFRDKYGYSP